MYCISLYLNIFCAILVKCVLLNRSAGTGRNKRLERYTNIVNQILTVMIRVHDGVDVLNVTTTGIIRY